MEKSEDIDDIDDDASISEIRTAIRELNQGEEPQSLKFYSSGKKEGVELMAFTKRRLGLLSQENENFIKYLTTPPFDPQILSKNNIKIHIETGMFYVDNRTTGESLYNFLEIQQDTTKKLNIDGDLRYYFNEFLSNSENDADDLRTNSISKFLFYNFNTLRVSGRKKLLQLRHSQISDDEFALEKLQSKSWSYFVESLIEISNDDIKYGDVIKTEAESYVIDKTIDNLDYCKDTFNRVFNDIAINLKSTLEHMQRRDVEKIQDKLGTKVFGAIDIIDNPNVTEVLQLLSRYFLKTGTFPTGKKSCLCP